MFCKTCVWNNERCMCFKVHGTLRGCPIFFCKQRKSENSDKYTIVWKQQMSWTMKRGLSCRARTRFSIMAHSTSSFCTSASFFNSLMAHRCSDPLRSASTTWLKKIEKQWASREIIHTYLAKFRVSGNQQKEIQIYLPKATLSNHLKEMIIGLFWHILSISIYK